MRSSAGKNFFLFFWLIAAADIFASALELSKTHMLLRPLLVPLLMIALILGSGWFKRSFIMLSGLFFSFLGDVLLLFESRGPSFFIAGLICFLLTHLFYCRFFLQIKSSNVSLLRKRPLLLILIILYTASLLYLLVPKLGALALPVITYACVLTAMLACSLHIYNFVNKAAANLFVTGAFFFVVSDSLLAINKFFHTFQYAGFFIMLSYCLAQYFIVKGYTRFRQSA